MMSDSTETYSHMPSTVMGTLLRWFDRSTVWLAEDHVLLASRVLWFERYNRFYFTDIQAVTICRTQTGRAWNIVLGAIAGLLTLGGVLGGFPPLVPVLLAIIALPLIGNILLGPTCSCHVHTAVNIRKMPCFNRLGKAIVFLQTVRPLIAEAQGEASNEENAEQASLTPPAARAQGALTPGSKRHYGGQVHTALLALLLSGAIISGVQLLMEEEFLTWLTAILLVAQFGMSIAAAARQSGTNIPRGLQTVTWLAFGHALVMLVLCLILFVVEGRETLERTIAAERFLEDSASEVSVASAASVMRYIMNLLSMLFSAIVCFTGLYILSAFPDNYRLKRITEAAQRRTLESQET